VLETTGAELSLSLQAQTQSLDASGNCTGSVVQPSTTNEASIMSSTVDNIEAEQTKHEEDNENESRCKSQHH
jgi:hypothetical protein